MSYLNVVFFGCNYNDKKIKSQFDSLKKRLEADTPLSCIVINKRKGKPARDIWQDIKDHIESSSACLFDTTGFRPNVVLELGYALSIKAEEQVYITFRKRKNQGKIPQWLLSDIGHLNRHEYIAIADLEAFMRQQLSLIPYMSCMHEFERHCDEANTSDKYFSYGLLILQKIRDEGPKSEQQIKGLLRGSNCRITTMTNLLKKFKLLKRAKGPNGKYSIPEDK